jgi:hypothetical protein
MTMRSYDGRSVEAVVRPDIPFLGMHKAEVMRLARWGRWAYDELGRIEADESRSGYHWLFTPDR